jgi:hypothetical protein
MNTIGFVSGCMASGWMANRNTDYVTMQRTHGKADKHKKKRRKAAQKSKRRNRK